jgi:hypothetical protein
LTTRTLLLRTHHPYPGRQNDWETVQEPDRLSLEDIADGRILWVVQGSAGWWRVCRACFTADNGSVLSSGTTAHFLRIAPHTVGYCEGCSADYPIADGVFAGHHPRRERGEPKLLGTSSPRYKRLTFLFAFPSSRSSWSTTKSSSTGIITMQCNQNTVET